MSDTSWLPILWFPVAALAIAAVIVLWTWPRKPRATKSHEHSQEKS